MLRAGDIVEVRSAAEIIDTLDERGSLENLPFMPEMLPFLGRRFVVAARVERACDTHTWKGARRLRNTVVLDDLRCDGTGHDGCAARCRLYWKEDWLRKVDNFDGAAPIDVQSLEELDRLVRPATTVPGTNGETIYRCQATELLRASTPVSGWNIASLRREVACGNVRPSRFARVMTAAVMTQAVQKTKDTAFRVAWKTVRAVGLRPLARRVRAQVEQEPERPKLFALEGLQPGELVQIRSRGEIMGQLDHARKTRGLYFDVAEMTPYCGRRATVLARVERFIDEPSGRMVELKSDCYQLDGVVCSGDRSERRWFCPRAIYPWWRESWLSKVDAPSQNDASSTAQ